MTISQSQNPLAMSTDRYVIFLQIKLHVYDRKQRIGYVRVLRSSIIIEKLQVIPAVEQMFFFVSYKRKRRKLDLHVYLLK